MTLSDKECVFVNRRRKLIRLWSVMGILLLILLGLFTLWMFMSNPLLVNPFEVADQLLAGTIETPTLQLMAGLLPVAMLMCLTTVLVLIIYVFAAIGNEKRYLEIIGRSIKD